MEKFYEDIRNFSPLEPLHKNGEVIGIKFKKTGVLPLDLYKQVLLGNTYNGLVFQTINNTPNKISFKKAIADLEESDEWKNKLWSINNCQNVVDLFYDSCKAPNTPETKSMKHDVAQQLFFMRNWFKYKQIYKFDEDFFDFIKNEDANEKIPTEILKTSLPCSAFFIDNTFKAGKFESDGCFVCFNEENYSDGDEISLSFYFNGKTFDGKETDVFQYGNIPLDLGNKSVNELLNNDPVPNALLPDNDNLRCEVNDLIAQALKCVIYMCASNKEVEVRKGRTGKEQYDVKQQMKKASQIGVNLKQDEVGVRIGNTIRQNRIVYEKNKDAVHHTGTPKSPHLRSGHYHSFWIGKKDGSEERKIILKFIPPLFIGKGKEMDVTVHKVEGMELE